MREPEAATGATGGTTQLLRGSPHCKDALASLLARLEVNQRDRPDTSGSTQNALFQLYENLHPT